MKSGRRPADKLQINRWSKLYDFSYIDLHRIFFVRGFAETLRAGVLGSLAGKRDSCFQGEPIRWHLFLPGTQPPRCPVVRRPSPIRPW